MRKGILIIFTLLKLTSTVIAQRVPLVESNIPFLVTFGKDGDKSWGDDDFSQTFFFVIPKLQTQPVYIRIFDPETSGENDEKKGDYNTKTKYSVYGGKGCFTNKSAQNNEPVGNYNSGNLMASKTFGDNSVYDQAWYTFGPFNPTEGEFVNEYGGYIFKIIAEGISGDDGNLYCYFLSTSPTENIPVEGGDAFTFEFTFRLSDNVNNVAHLYPYVEENVTSVKISNFDFDNDGQINFTSVTKKTEINYGSGNNVWSIIEHMIIDEEKKHTIDVQLIKNKKILVKNNNITLFVTNQYDNLIPIHTVPIGGLTSRNSILQFNKPNKTRPDNK